WTRLMTDGPGSARKRRPRYLLAITIQPSGPKTRVATLLLDLDRARDALPSENAGSSLPLERHGPTSLKDLRPPPDKKSQWREELPSEEIEDRIFERAVGASTDLVDLDDDTSVRLLFRSLFGKKLEAGFARSNHAFSNGTLVIDGSTSGLEVLIDGESAATTSANGTRIEHVRAGEREVTIIDPRGGRRPNPIRVIVEVGGVARISPGFEHPAGADPVRPIVLYGGAVLGVAGAVITGV